MLLLLLLLIAVAAVAVAVAVAVAADNDLMMITGVLLLSAESTVVHNRVGETVCLLS